MRLARIVFRNEILKEGLNPEHLEDLFAEIPKEVKVIGFAQDYCRNLLQVTLECDKFKEVRECDMLPELVPVFTEDEECEFDCDIDFSEVLEDGYEHGYDEGRAVFKHKGYYGSSEVVFDEVVDIERRLGWQTDMIDASRYYLNNGKLIIASTPRAGKNIFYKMWQESLEKDIHIPEYLGIDESEKGDWTEVREFYHKETNPFAEAMVKPLIEKTQELLTEENNCNHEMVSVQGIYKKHTYCKKCGKKESEL